MIRLSLSILIVCFFIVACNSKTGPEAMEPTSSAEQKLDSISTQLNKAKDLQAAGKTAEASTIVDAMLKKYPGQLDALSLKAQLLKDEGKTAEAIALLEKAHALQPRDKELAYDLAYEYADAKNPKAVSFSDTLIKYDKTATVARAWYIKATYYNKTGHTKEAMRYLDSATITDFNFLDAYLDKGQLLLQQQNYEQALKTFALGQKISPATADFYFWVAKTQAAMGNKLDAKANFERAYSLDKTMTEAKTERDKL